MARITKDNAKSDVKIEFDKDVLLDYAKQHFERAEKDGVTWNGRQIRNAFQTAIALGQWERRNKILEAGFKNEEEAMATGKKKWRKVQLTKKSFKSIAKTSRDFENYIANLRGSDSLYAKEAELRYDDYDPDRTRARKVYPTSGAAQMQSSMRGGGRGKGKKSVRRRDESSDEDEQGGSSEEMGDESSEDEDSDSE